MLGMVGAAMRAAPVIMADMETASSKFAAPVGVAGIRIHARFDSQADVCIISSAQLALIDKKIHNFTVRDTRVSAITDWREITTAAKPLGEVDLPVLFLAQVRDHSHYVPWVFDRQHKVRFLVVDCDELDCIYLGANTITARGSGAGALYELILAGACRPDELTVTFPFNVGRANLLYDDGTNPPLAAEGAYKLDHVVDPVPGDPDDDALCSETLEGGCRAGSLGPDPESRFDPSPRA
jgi:hypothetical protein